VDLPISKRRVIAVSAMSFAMLAAVSGSALAQPTTEQALSVDNEPTEVLSGVQLLQVEDALLTRDEDRLIIEITMDVPTPGTYKYPDVVPPERQASPEAFTMWTFIFNHPDECTDSEPPFLCGGEDFTEAAKGGIYGIAGHVPSIDHSGGAFELNRALDGRMILTGEVKVGDPQRANMPEDEITFPLSNPMGAEVHVAIAPHGQIDPAALGEELYSPFGGPTCGCWWSALFPPPAN
jgi:hypothetical protein